MLFYYQFQTSFRMRRETVMNRMTKKTSDILRIIIPILCFLLVVSHQQLHLAAADETEAAEDLADSVIHNENYMAQLYDNTNSLTTSVANGIAQTDDGFIWIGSYGGLTRFDGTAFTRIDAKERVLSVGCLYTDHQGWLWIGTNEDGVALMTRDDFLWWNVEDGLAAAKVRCITESDDGNIYIGTISGISVIGSDMQVRTLKDAAIANVYIEKMKPGKDGIIYCISSEGDFFSIRGDQLLSYYDHSRMLINDVTSILPDPNDSDMIYFGTESSVIYHCNAGSAPTVIKAINIYPLSSVSNMQYINGRLWICAHNGIGVIDDEGFHHLSHLPFLYSVKDVMEDYEGNLWFSSSRQGVMKLTLNRFTNIFENYDIPEQVINSTCMYGDELFIGSETGLIVLGKKGPLSSVPVTKSRYASGGAFHTADLIQLLKGCRIRSIIRDSKDRLWISTWQAYGLLRYDHGELTLFTEQEGLPSNRVRTVHETEDGSIIVVGTGGICVIQDDRVTACYDENNKSIMTKESLTVSSAPNGDILVGSNGGGIYIIGENGTQCIDSSRGLSSGVVMRIKYDQKRDLFWLVTGNSIAYMTSDYKVTTIDHFPYQDNLDLYENDRGEMWVLSSNGLYVAPVDDLIANEEIHYIYYGIPNGLPGHVVSNSYSELTDDGDLYISSNVCVAKVNINEPLSEIQNIKQAVPYIEVDDQLLYADPDGTFTVPANVKKIAIYGYVLNYSLSDPVVTIQLKGFDQEPMIFRQSTIHPMYYTNLKGGSYEYVMTIKDEFGNNSKSLSVQIIKIKTLIERLWFNLLLGTALLALVLVVVRLYIKRNMRILEKKHHEEAERERVNNELRMANQIQMGMLPNEYPPFPDRKEFDIYARMDPAREVGGDFYDYFFVDDDHLCMVIADVSGKGIPASLFMMSSKVVLQSVAQAGLAVDEILHRVNQTICANNKLDMFVTVWIGILEISTGKLTASNAGHEYPVIKRAESGYELIKDKHGFVIGSMEDMKYTGYELQLHTGDQIFVYTDGLLEATNEAGEMFGKDRMIEALNHSTGGGPEEVLTAVRQAVDAFVGDAEQFDDLTMLCLEYFGK